MVFCLLSCLFSCNKTKENDYPELILGKWKAIKLEAYYNGELDEDESELLDETWFFSSTGECLEESDRSKYSITGQWLTLDYGRKTLIVKIQKLTRKELVLVGSQHENEEIWVYFERIE